MHLKKAWNDWGSVTVAIGACLGTFLLYLRAWHTGYAGSAIGLLGCHMLRLPLLLLAWLAVSSEFKTAASKGGPPIKPRFSLFDFVGSLIIFVGCIGCYPIWPFVLALLAIPLVWAVILYKKQAAEPLEVRRVRQALLSVGISILLFTLTWFLSASTTGQALHGLGARIEDLGGTDKLLVWAKDAIAEVKARKLPQRFEIEELPDWVKEMLGQNEGVRGARISEYVDETCVYLYTGSSAYHFRIDVCPSRINHGTPPWWAGEGGGLELRPGILLNVEGK
jgi:hypothetical protein